MRILGFDKPEPARTAGGKHGTLFKLACNKTLHEFIGLFHDRQVRREGGIKYIVSSHLL